MDGSSDVRVFVMDNHRPVHLSNIYSRYNIVVFDDMNGENIDIDDTIPSDGSVLSASEQSSSSSSSDDDEDDEEEDEVNDEEEEEELEEDVRNRGIRINL